MGISPRLGQIAVGIVLALTAAACQGDGRSQSPALASISDIDRLINSDLTFEEHAILINANDSVVEKCMQALGWDFEIGPATPETAQGGPRSLTRFGQWTFADAAFAQTSGFDLRNYVRELDAFIERMETGSKAAHIPDPDLMTPDERARLDLDYFGRDDERVGIIQRDGSETSISGGGCLGEATRAVYGDDIALKLRLEDARSSAASTIWSTVLSSDKVTAALGNWKSCVSRSGDDFETPADVFEAAFKAARAADFESEQRLAVLTAQCSTDAGLADAVEAAYLSAGTAAMPDLEDDLLALQRFEKEALERAKAIIKTGG